MTRYYRGQDILLDAATRLPVSPHFPVGTERSCVAHAPRRGGGRTDEAVLLSDGAEAPEGTHFVPLRSLFDSGLEVDVLADALSGYHLALWREKTSFCGKCAAPLGDSSEDSGRVCPACGGVYYPRISPAVVVRVTKGDSILLARNARGYGNVMSHVAGFLEPGESLEEAARRELLEEVGIEVGALRYEGSQPWPFPDSLMVGFSAEWKAREIACDETEIAEAAWFTRDSLPALPRPGSLSRRMIDEWIQGGRNGRE